MLRALFEDFSINAQKVVDRLNQGAALPPSEIRRLIEYGKRLIGDIQVDSNRISEMIREIESAGFEQLLQTIDKGSIRESSAPNAGPSAWQSQWAMFRHWFIAQPDSPSSSQVLRDSAEAAIANLLRNIRDQREQQGRRFDRAADYLILARWFAEAASDEDAHCLWRAAFGLNSSRHWTIDDASLVERESHHISLDTSWRDAPPLRMPANFQKYSVRTAAAAVSRIIDRHAEKEKLAVLSREEAQRVLSAQRRFCIDGRIRLSDLQDLACGELDLLLDLLGEAMSARIDSIEPVEIFFADGSLKIRLEPAGENQNASIQTSEGILRGPDQWMSIEPVPYTGEPGALP